VGGASVADGARTSVYLATAATVSQISGRYFIDYQPTAPAPKAQDIEQAEALWRASENALRPWLPIRPSRRLMTVLISPTATVTSGWYRRETDAPGAWPRGAENLHGPSAESPAP